MAKSALNDDAILRPTVQQSPPLDEFMGWTKYNRYSILVVRNLSELATKLSYRTAAKAVELLAPFTVSHQKINSLVNQAGQEVKKQQTSNQRYDALEKPKTAPKVLYLEGDGFMVKGVGMKSIAFRCVKAFVSAGRIAKNESIPVILFR